MFFNFKLVKIDYKYCDFLRKYDARVPYNSGIKELRPFVGVLFAVNDMEYFAPLSSPKEKHLKMRNTIDFYKIDDGKLGAINFNNMIPVNSNNYKLINLNAIPRNIDEKKYYKLLSEQLDYLNEHYFQIINKSYKLYTLYNENKLSKNIVSRCCNFKLLEEKCLLYNEDIKVTI